MEVSPTLAAPGQARVPPLASVAVVGGCGHVGLPLGLSFVERGHAVTLFDTSPSRVASVMAGQMPFFERGAAEALARGLASRRLSARVDLEGLADHDVAVVTIGTPIDEFLNPDVQSFDRAMERVLSFMRRGQLLILRSTVFPGVTDRLGLQIHERGLGIDVAYAPERIAQGYAMEELVKLPQLVGGTSLQGSRRAVEFFKGLGAKVLEVKPIDAELAKLFSNTYRYINFAISNQLYMMAQHFEADFSQIYRAVTEDYPRMAGFARAGFAGGPCLLKDTMQLAAFNHNRFTLGQAAMMVNEGLPTFLVEELKRSRDLRQDTVAILGMAFKGNCDDPRSSLAYKLRKILSLECKAVLCTDPYIHEPGFVPLDEALTRADVLILGATHDAYRHIATSKPIVDVFDFAERSPA